MTKDIGQNKNEAIIHVNTTWGIFQAKKDEILTGNMHYKFRGEYIPVIAVIEAYMADERLRDCVQQGYTIGDTMLNILISPNIDNIPEIDRTYVVNVCKDGIEIDELGLLPWSDDKDILTPIQKREAIELEYFGEEDSGTEQDSSTEQDITITQHGELTGKCPICSDDNRRNNVCENVLTNYFKCLGCGCIIETDINGKVLGIYKDSGLKIEEDDTDDQITMLSKKYKDILKKWDILD